LKILIILNGVSRKKKKFYASILPILQKRFQVTVAETTYAGHAQHLAAQALSQKFDCVLAAGGDGTLHQVINGLLNTNINYAIPSVGLIPLGSGNDFATTCGLTDQGELLQKLLEANSPKPIDVGKIICRDVQGNEVVKCFVNACSIGMGPATVLRMEKSPKWLGADLRYFISILHTFFTHMPQAVHVKTNSWEWSGKVRVLAIANGKSFGNKIFIAPDAKPDDGLFNTFLAGEVTLAKFLWFLQLLKRKNKITHSMVGYSEVAEVEMSSPKKVAIEGDGEIVGYLPVKVRMMTSAILFYA
jgi:diacylglycerol kinase (ATP)